MGKADALSRGGALTGHEGRDETGYNKGQADHQKGFHEREGPA